MNSGIPDERNVRTREIETERKVMQIQIMTDKNIEGSEKLIAQVETAVERSLCHFSDRITRVEVHLSDENSHKGGGDDKRCVMEARLKRRQPVAGIHQAGTLLDAVDGAAERLKATLDHNIGRVRAKRRRQPTVDNASQLLNKAATFYERTHSI